MIKRIIFLCVCFSLLSGVGMGESIENKVDRFRKEFDRVMEKKTVEPDRRRVIKTSLIRRETIFMSEDYEAYTEYKREVGKCRDRLLTDYGY